MFWKPKPVRDMPPEIAEVRDLIPEGSVYRLVGDVLYAKYDDAD
jgi:transposase